MKRLAILGSTGSIGRSTLDVITAFPDRFRAVTLAAGRNVERLAEQIASHRPELVSVAEEDDARRLREQHPGLEVASGPEGLVAAACHDGVDLVVAGLVGSVGLVPTLAAVEAGTSVALANKETLVVAGDLVTAAARRSGAEIIPVDSEHNAIHQALRVGPREAVRRILLTASGGPFRTWPAARIRAATVRDALAHPTWEMGPKITVDSATMMNKGLEIIEAHHLFGLASDQIDVVVHPQSLVHSLVEYVDGTLIAQLSINDMRFPILYALAWPQRLPSPMPSLDLVQAGTLTFEAPDTGRFPALRLARAALEAGGEMPAVLNAANEVAVGRFLEGGVPVPAIAEVVEEVMASWAGRNRGLDSLEQALEVDREARREARLAMGKFLSRSGRS